MIFLSISVHKLPMTKYQANISHKNFIRPKIVNQGGSSDKLIIFGPRYACAKNFEFALRNPLVDNFRSYKIFLTYICPHIWL